MKSSKEEGVGIAGTMDQDVPVGMFKCNYCGSVHETPAVAKAVPMRFWCSTDCWEKDNAEYIDTGHRDNGTEEQPDLFDRADMDDRNDGPGDEDKEEFPYAFV